MTESTPPETKKKPQSFWVDMGPVIVFVIAYQLLQRNGIDGAIYKAGGVFMMAAFAGLVYSRLKLGRFSGMLVFTTVVIGVTVGLAYLFRNPTFLYIKPTVMNVAYGILAIGGVIAKRNLIRLMMGSAIELPERAWNVLAIRWGIFFFVLALINEVVWRNFSEEFWVNFKLLGFLPITLIFTLLQIPFIQRYGRMITDEKAE